MNMVTSDYEQSIYVWTALKGVSSFTSPHYLWRSVGPFSTLFLFTKVPVKHPTSGSSCLQYPDIISVMFRVHVFVVRIVVRCLRRD